MRNCPNWAKECCHHSFRSYFRGDEVIDVEIVMKELPEKDRQILRMIFDTPLKLTESVEIASHQFKTPVSKIFKLIQKTSLELLKVRGCIDDED